MANIDTGIEVVNGLSLKAAGPLDNKLTASTITERDSYITANVAYKGMIVYVEADDKYYKYDGSAFVEYMNDVAKQSNTVTTDTAQDISGAKNFTTRPTVTEDGETSPVATQAEVTEAVLGGTTAEIGKTIQAHSDVLDQLSEVTGTGIVAKTADGFAPRTLSSTDLDVANGDGVAGNPTVNLKASGVSAGSYTKVTVSAKGIVTDGSNPTTLAGYGITDGVNKEGDTLTGALTYEGVASFEENDLVSKSYVDNAVSTKLASALKYKGTVDSESALPTSGNEVGDLYNVEDTGANYAWNGTAWDKLSETIDLSGYLGKTETAAAATKLANARTFTTDLASTTPASFDGTDNATAGVTGTLPVGHGGTGATTLTANQLVVGNGTSAVKSVTNAEGVLVGTASDAPSFGKADLTKHVTGVLPVANGGTGASTAAGAFDALAPTGAKGDLIVNNGSGNVALSAGADGTLLTPDSSSATGYKWVSAISGGTF